MGRGNKGGVGGFQHQQIPSGDPAGAGATSLLLRVVFIAGLLVVALCRRRKKTQRNTEECRRLMERVKWLRDLLQLLRSSSSLSAPPQMTMEEEGAAPTTTATRRLHHLRAALVGSLDAAVSEADGLAGSWAVRCCLCGFARCDAVARRLERAKADVDEIYVQVLPVVSQVDATHRVVHMMLGVGTLPAHRVITETTPTTPTTSQNGGGDDRNSSADSHSGIQLAGFDGIHEAPIEFDFNSWAEHDDHVYHYQQERRLRDRPLEIDHEINLSTCPS